jgi:hypothetical protein
MATKNTKSTGSTGTGRVKFKYMEIEMEGENQTLADGLKALASAISRGNVALPTGGRPAPTLKGAPTTSVEELEEGEIGPEEQDFPEEEAEQTSSTNGNGKPKKKYVPKAPKFLSELDLTKADIKLADFLAEKNPSEMFDKYTVVAVWFKQHYNTDEISQDHIFTAFKHLGWQSQLPEDVGSPLRALKSQRNWFDKGSGKGLYKINWSGESAVLKMGAGK